VNSVNWRDDVGGGVGVNVVTLLMPPLLLAVVLVLMHVDHAIGVGVKR
jgi:hypothetical protein